MKNAKLDSTDQDAEIDMLVNMGFTVERVTEALEASSGSVNHAVNALVAVDKLEEADDGAHAKTKIIDGPRFSPDTVASTRQRHETMKNKSQLSPDTAAPSNRRSNIEHVHQFDAVFDSIEEQEGKRIFSSMQLASRRTLLNKFFASSHVADRL